MKLRLFCAVACFAASAQVFAQVTTSTGTIKRMDAVGSAGGAPGNADTRVFLNGVSTFCTGSSDASWAFINVNDANYKGVLATLMLAYGTGKSVTINAVPAQVGSGTYCQITWINVIG